MTIRFPLTPALIPAKAKIFEAKDSLCPINHRSRRMVPFPPRTYSHSQARLQKVDIAWQRTIEDRQGELFDHFHLNRAEQNKLIQEIRQAMIPIKSLLMPIPAQKIFIKNVLKWAACEYQQKLAVLNIGTNNNTCHQRIEFYDLKNHSLTSDNLEQIKNDLRERVFTVYLHNVRLNPETIERLSRFLETYHEELHSFAIFSQDSRYFEPL